MVLIPFFLAILGIILVLPAVNHSGPCSQVLGLRASRNLEYKGCRISQNAFHSCEAPSCSKRESSNDLGETNTDPTTCRRKDAFKMVGDSNFTEIRNSSINDNMAISTYVILVSLTYPQLTIVLQSASKRPLSFTLWNYIRHGTWICWGWTAKRLTHNKW